MATVTIIPVMYRDAANYKVHGEIVLDGAITDEQRQQLRAALSEGEYYIPEQLGYTHLAKSTTQAGWGGFPDMDDHCWHELDVDAIEVTEDHGVTTGTIEEFVAKFVKAGEEGWKDDKYGL